MIADWNSEDNARLATTVSALSGKRYHLSVERLPPDDWEWIAWRAACVEEQVLHGVSKTIDSAMDAAECAVDVLDGMRSAERRRLRVGARG